MRLQDLLLEVTLKLGRIDSRLAHMEHMMEQAEAVSNEYERREPWESEMHKAVIGCHRRGASIRQIELTTGVPKSTAHRWIKQHRDATHARDTEA